MTLLFGGSVTLEHLFWLEKVSAEIVGMKKLRVPIGQLIMRGGASGLVVLNTRASAFLPEGWVSDA